MGKSEAIKSAVETCLMSPYGSIDRPGDLDCDETEWGAALGEALRARVIQRLESKHRALELAGVVPERDAHLVIRLYEVGDIFPPLDLIDAVASRGEAVLDGLVEELLGLPEKWSEQDSLHMAGGNLTEHFAVFLNLCLSIMEICRRASRTPPEAALPTLHELLSTYQFNGFCTHAIRLEYLERVRDMFACLPADDVERLTRPGDGPVNWETIGFAPDEARAQRVVDELVAESFWTYKDWNQVEATSEANASNRIAETFTLLGVSAVSPLSKLVKKGGAKIRAGVVCALGFTGDDSAIEPLVVAMQDSSARVRRVASNGLLRFDHEKVRAALEPLTKSRKAKVRESALELVGRLD